VLGNLRTFIWIRVQQFTALEIQVGLFRHIHQLSLKWHMSRKTGEVLRVMERGTSSINNLLQYLVFSIVPTFIDIGIAIIYFCVEFNYWFGLIIFLAMVLYLTATIMITEWRTKFRREMNLKENDQRTKGLDSLLNAETVKYFSMEDWETERYKKSIELYQVEEWKTNASLTFLNMVQMIVLNGALVALTLYCSYLVSEERVLTVGDFVLLGTYFMQLMTPLNYIGTLYRIIQESFVNMENMFDLMNEEMDVQDLPDCVPYKKTDRPPAVEFFSCDFHYTHCKPVLKNVSFKIEAGTTTALVGSSGSGKTTVAKLLIRMFDVKKGKITFGGEDIKSYSQASLRQAMGVVPQDTVLFNDTIKYNIKYGNMDATDAEVEEAASLADIHDTILSFPDKYETMVGERGVKLSGGERQRVAIARTLIRKPSLMIFDEATSSLDSTTERHIQSAIERASKERTSLIVAHRLSTVVRAEQIVVMDQGEVIEVGNHRELVEKGGRYAELWEHQQQEENGEIENEKL
jgi:ATP-binding cassette subfamily B (MDR/TAP) protein 6